MEKTDNKVPRKYMNASEFPNEITVSGSVLNHTHERREWEKDGEKKSLDLDVLFLQGDYGVCVVRAYRPTFDFSMLKIGDVVCFPVEKFEKENGLKAFSVRV